MPTPGTYQEVKIVDERYLARKPDRLSFAEAAAAPLASAKSDDGYCASWAASASAA